MEASSTPTLKAERTRLSFRTATPDDRDFLVELYKSSRGDDLRGLGWPEDKISEFLEMQYAAFRTLLESDHPFASEEIILCAAENAGARIVARSRDEMRCVDLALLPDHQERGLGTSVIQNLQNEAVAAGCCLRLQVLRFNRAVHLFERLGFRRTAETGTHIQLEWTAQCQPATE